MKAYKLAFWKFLEHVDDTNKSFYASRAIRAYMEAGEPIPDELVPIVRQALNALLSKEGNDARTLSTRDKRRERVEDVCLLVDKAGYKLTDAIESVAKKENVGEDTLKKEYYSVTKEQRAGLDLSDAANRLAMKKY